MTNTSNVMGTDGIDNGGGEDGEGGGRVQRWKSGTVGKRRAVRGER